MKISIEWLKEYVDVQESPEKLKEDLSMIGLLVEAISEVRRNARPRGRGDFKPAGLPEPYRNCHENWRPVSAASEESAGPGNAGGFSGDNSLQNRNTGCGSLSAIRRARDWTESGSATSPRWMQQRLEAAGMRPLNNIVDITNYVLLEMGHPLHAFDFDVLRQGKIVVARARQGEKMQTLDGDGSRPGRRNADDQ